MTQKPCIICVRDHRIAAEEVRQPGGADHHRRADRVGARGLRGRRHHRPRPRPQRRRAARPPIPAASRTLLDGLRKHCPGLIVQLSTGGRSGAGRERGAMLGLKPDMASLAVGSNNFPTRVYENSPDLVDWLAAEMLVNKVKPEIEAFDLSHIFQAVAMAEAGKLTRAALRPVRHGREERHAGRPPGLRLLRRDPEAPRAGRGMVRRRHRPPPDHPQRVVRRLRRPRPHRPRGQRPPRPRHAGALERRPRPPRRRALRQARAPGRDRGPGPRHPRPPRRAGGRAGALV